MLYLLIMNSTSLFKLGGVALAAWASLVQAGLDSRSFGVVAVLLILMALLDAGQPVARSHESGQAPADSQAFSRRFFSLACAPFYLVLIILTFVSTQGRQSQAEWIRCCAPRHQRRREP